MFASSAETENEQQSDEFLEVAVEESQVTFILWRFDFTLIT